MRDLIASALARVDADARREERERAARIADTFSPWTLNDYAGKPLLLDNSNHECRMQAVGMVIAANRIADAIRALASEPQAKPPEDA